MFYKNKFLWSKSYLIILIFFILRCQTNMKRKATCTKL